MCELSKGFCLFDIRILHPYIKGSNVDHFVASITSASDIEQQYFISQ